MTIQRVIQLKMLIKMVIIIIMIMAMAMTIIMLIMIMPIMIMLIIIVTKWRIRNAKKMWHYKVCLYKNIIIILIISIVCLILPLFSLKYLTKTLNYCKLSNLNILMDCKKFTTKSKLLNLRQFLYKIIWWPWWKARVSDYNI